MPLSLLAIWSLALRELKRFVRQRNRVFGALAQPLIFWALFGVGLSPSFRAGGSASVDYFEYFFPGTVVLILLFTAIFATISIIDDRNAGFLQSVLVAPVSRASIVGGKILGTTILSVGQATLVLAFAPFAGISLGPVEVIGTLLLMIVIAIGLAGLGFAIAWRMDSTQGFHAIMMSFLMPMWFLSGAFFPSAGSSATSQRGTCVLTGLATESVRLFEPERLEATHTGDSIIRVHLGHRRALEGTWGGDEDAFLQQLLREVP